MKTLFLEEIKYFTVVFSIQGIEKYPQYLYTLIFN